MKSATATKARYVQMSQGPVNIEDLKYVTSARNDQWAGFVRQLGSTVQTGFWYNQAEALADPKRLVEQVYRRQSSLSYKLIRPRYALAGRRTPKF